MVAIFFLNSCFNHEQRATVISGRNWGFRWSTIGTYRGWLSSSFKDLTNLTSSCLNTTMFSRLMHVNIYDKCWSALAPVCISGITGLTVFPVLSHMSVLQWFDSLPDVSISVRKSPLDHCLHIVKLWVGDNGCKQNVGLEWAEWMLHSKAEVAPFEWQLKNAIFPTKKGAQLPPGQRRMWTSRQLVSGFKDNHPHALQRSNHGCQVISPNPLMKTMQTSHR